MYSAPPPPMYTGPPPPMAQPAAVTIIVPVTVHWANGCANCGSPPSRWSSTSLKIGRTRRTYQVPVCEVCAKREVGHRRLVGFLFFLVLAGSAGLGYAQLPLRERALFALPGGVFVAFLVGLFFFIMLKPKPPVPPFTSGTEAVRLTAWNANQAWFYCTNADWAMETMRLSGGSQIAPTKEKPYRAWGTLFTFPILAGVLELIGMGVARPDVMYRNDTSKALAFYVDGAKLTTLEPGKYELHNATYGHHTIGWSPASDAKPASTIDANVQMLHSHLVNPDEAGCFWLDGAAYGAAHVDEKTLGPLPLETFYTFDKVDLWFTSLPKSITTKQSGETRIAVQVYPLCVDELKSCQKALVQQALACDRAASNNDDGAKCWAACDGKTHADDKPKEPDVAATAMALANAKLVDAGPADAGAPTKKKKKKKPAP